MITITEATPKDIPALRDMIIKLCAFHGDPCHLGLAEAQAQLIDGPLQAFIARHDGQIGGYAVLEPHWRPMNTGPAWDIVHLFVEEPLRGRGVGRELIKAAKEFASTSKACRLTIGTSPDNPGAAAAYRAIGLDEITATPGARFSVPLCQT